MNPVAFTTNHSLLIVARRDPWLKVGEIRNWYIHATGSNNDENRSLLSAFSTLDAVRLDSRLISVAAKLEYLVL